VVLVLTKSFGLVWAFGQSLVFGLEEKRQSREKGWAKSLVYIMAVSRLSAFDVIYS